jgi:hypothetical protein
MISFETILLAFSGEIASQGGLKQQTQASGNRGLLYFCGFGLLAVGLFVEAMRSIPSKQSCTSLSYAQTFSSQTMKPAASMRSLKTKSQWLVPSHIPFIR